MGPGAGGPNPRGAARLGLPLGRVPFARVGRKGARCMGVLSVLTRLMVVRDPVLKLADALAERASHLWQFLRAEDEQDDEDEDRDVPGTDKAGSHAGEASSHACFALLAFVHPSRMRGRYAPRWEWLIIEWWRAGADWLLALRPRRGRAALKRLAPLARLR